MADSPRQIGQAMVHRGGTGGRARMLPVGRRAQLGWAESRLPGGRKGAGRAPLSCEPRPTWVRMIRRSMRSISCDDAQASERQRPRAAFLYMMGPGSAANLAQSLQLLHANHRRWHPYKVLVFAPQDVTPKDLADLKVRAYPQRSCPSPCIWPQTTSPTVQRWADSEDHGRVVALSVRLGCHLADVGVDGSRMPAARPHW